MRYLNRKGRLLVVGLAATALASASLVASAFAQADEPIRIGMIYSKQGPGASIGQFLQRGSDLAVEQAGGKVLGRKIEIIWLDETDPQGSQQNMQRLVDENKVVAVVGGNYSSNALAMMSVANRTKTPLILPGAAASADTALDQSHMTCVASIVRPPITPSPQSKTSLWGFLFYIFL